MRIKGIGRGIAGYATDQGYRSGYHSVLESRRTARSRAWCKRTYRRAERRDAAKVIAEYLGEASCQ